MIGQLFEGHTVDLVPQTAITGGSWIPDSGDPLQAHGQNMLRLFYELVCPLRAPVVLDIGANTGSFCLLAKFLPSARFYAFEPVIDVAELLFQNIGANGLFERVTICPFALSDQGGAGVMHVPLNARFMGLSYLDNRDPNLPCQLETVQVATLDTWIERSQIDHIDAIKMDVEGIESRVLRGGEQVITRDHPLIMLEATNINQTIPILEGWGYTIENHQTDLVAHYERK